MKKIIIFKFLAASVLFSYTLPGPWLLNHVSKNRCLRMNRFPAEFRGIESSGGQKYFIRLRLGSNVTLSRTSHINVEEALVSDTEIFREELDLGLFSILLNCGFNNFESRQKIIEEYLERLGVNIKVTRPDICGTLPCIIIGDANKNELWLSNEFYVLREKVGDQIISFDHWTFIEGYTSKYPLDISIKNSQTKSERKIVIAHEALPPNLLE